MNYILLTASMNDALSDAIAGALGALGGLMLFGWLLGLGILIGTVAIITWVVKKIWYWKPRKKRHNWQSNDWMTNAQERQNRRYEYSDPIKPKGNRQSTNQDGRKWYPTGWTFNEETQLWEPPDYLQQQSHEKWRWDPEKEIWVDTEKETKMAKYRKFREGKEPTFEEWKAARERDANK